MRKPLQGHSDECRKRIVEQLCQQPMSKRGDEQPEETRDAKLARYFERHDQAQAGAQHPEQEVLAGPVSGGTQQTGASGGSGPREAGHGASSNLAAGSSTATPRKRCGAPCGSDRKRSQRRSGRAAHSRRTRDQDCRQGISGRVRRMPSESAEATTPTGVSSSSTGSATKARSTTRVHTP